MADVKLILRGKNVAGEAFSQLRKDVEKTNKSIDEGAKKWGKSLRTAGKVMIAVGAILTATLGMAIKTTADFQQSMANVQSVAGATGAELQKLTGYAREMGATSVFAASEAADAMYFLASAGFETEQIMGALAGTLSLAAATQSDLAFTSETVAATLSAYGLAAEEAGRVSNVFAATISGTQATMSKLAISMGYIAPIAKSVNMSLEETAAILGTLFSSGIAASTAGTALRQAITKLINPVGKAGETLRRLQIATKDSSGQMRNFTDILRDLEEANLSTKDAVVLFGQRAGPGLLALISKGADSVEALEAKITGTNKAAEMAAMQINTFKGALRILKSAVEELNIAVGSTLMPLLTGLVRHLTNVVSAASAWARAHPVLTGILAKFAGVMALIMVTGGPLLMFAPQILKIISTLKLFMAFVQGMGLIANPMLAAAVAITAVAAAVIYLSVKAIRGRDVMKDLAKTVGEVTDQSERADAIKQIAERIDELRAKADKTEDELRELKKIEEDLVSLSPSFITSLNEQGDAFEANTERAKKYAEQIIATTEAQKAVLQRRFLEQQEKENKNLAEARERMVEVNAELVRLNDLYEAYGNFDIQTVTPLFGDQQPVSMPIETMIDSQNRLVENAQQSVLDIEDSLKQIREGYIRAGGTLPQIIQEVDVKFPEPEGVEDPGITKPEALKRGMEAVADLEKARIEMIENTFAKSLQMADAEYAATQAKIKDEQKLVDDQFDMAETTEKAHAEQSMILTNELAVAKLTRDKEVNDAEKKQAKEFTDAYRAFTEAQIQSVENRHERATQLAQEEVKAAEANAERERSEIMKSGLIGEQQAKELSRVNTTLVAARLAGINKIGEIEKEQNAEIFQKSSARVSSLASLELMNIENIAKGEAERYRAAGLFEERIRAAKGQEIAAAKVRHNAAINLLDLEAQFTETTEERKAQIVMERMQRTLAFGQLERDTRVTMEKEIADNTKRLDAEILGIKTSTLQAYAQALDDSFAQEIALENLSYQESVDKIQARIDDKETEAGIRAGLIQQLSGMEAEHDKKLADLSKQRVDDVKAEQQKTIQLTIDGISDRFEKARQGVLMEYDMGITQVKKLEDEKLLTRQQAQERRFALAEQLILRLGDIEKEAAIRQRQEEAATFGVMMQNEQIRSSLKKDSLERELDQVKQNAVVRLRSIDDEMHEEGISIERRKALETQLQLVKLQYAEEYKNVIRNQSVIIRSLSDEVGALPFEFGRALMEARRMQEDHEDALRSMYQERELEINDVYWSETLSASKKSRQIERIEKESADRRYQIEKEHSDRIQDLFEGVVTSFLAGIGKQFEQTIQEKLSDKIFDGILQLTGKLEVPELSTENLATTGLTTATQAQTTATHMLTTATGNLIMALGSLQFTGGASGGIGGLAEIASGLPFGPPEAPQMDQGLGGLNLPGLISGFTGSGKAGLFSSMLLGLATGNPLALLQGLPLLMSFDDPNNDASARRSGRNTAMLRSMHFADPTNDAIARMSGLKSATALGRKSADDIVNEFSTGFTQGAAAQDGGSNSGLGEAINALIGQLGNMPEFNLVIDGKEITSTVTRRQDKTTYRKQAH